MPFPTTILDNPVVALVGQVADSGSNQDPGGTISGQVINATIAPGLLAVWHAGDADNTVRAPAATGEVTGFNPRGVTIYEASSPNNPYAIGDVIGLLKRGRIWVATEEAVTPASTPFVRFAAGAGGTVLGAFRASADTATAVALPGAKFVSTQATPGGLVLLEINIP